MLRKVIVIFVSLVILVLATLTTAYADGPRLSSEQGSGVCQADFLDDSILGLAQKYLDEDVKKKRTHKSLHGYGRGKKDTDADSTFDRREIAAPHHLRHTQNCPQPVI